MARIATVRIKAQGQWIAPGQELPAGVSAADIERLIAAGHVREEATPAEVAAAQRYAAKVAGLREKADGYRAVIAAAESRLAEIDALSGDEAKAAEKEAKKLTADIAKAKASLDKTLDALSALE